MADFQNKRIFGGHATGMMIGGATGFGKTTFLKCGFSRLHVQRCKRIITIEDNAELADPGVWENLVRLEQKRQTFWNQGNRKLRSGDLDPRSFAYAAEPRNYRLKWRGAETL